MTRRSCWLPERHVSENDELDNQKLSHTHLYPVSQIMMGSVASFASRTPLILGIKNPYLGLDIPRNGLLIYLGMAYLRLDSGHTLAYVDGDGLIRVLYHSEHV